MCSAAVNSSVEDYRRPRSTSGSSSSVPKEEMIKLAHESFREADIDRGGSLDSTELAQVIRTLYKAEGILRSKKLVDDEVSRAMLEFDADSSGKLDETEFVNMFLNSREFKFKCVQEENEMSARSLGTEHFEGVLKTAQSMFDEFDCDKSGKLDAEELAKVLRLMYKEEGVARSLAMVNEEVKEAMRQFDTDRSGELDFDEFMQMFLRSASFKFKIEDETRCAILIHLENERQRAVEQELKKVRVEEQGVAGLRQMRHFMARFGRSQVVMRLQVWRSRMIKAAGKDAQTVLQSVKTDVTIMREMGKLREQLQSQAAVVHKSCSLRLMNQITGRLRNGSVSMLLEGWRRAVKVSALARLEAQMRQLKAKAVSSTMLSAQKEASVERKIKSGQQTGALRQIKLIMTQMIRGETSARLQEWKHKAIDAVRTKEIVGLRQELAAQAMNTIDILLNDMGRLDEASLTHIGSLEAMLENSVYMES